jgi:hypothetical protein
MVDIGNGTGFSIWRKGLGERLRLARPNGEEVAGKIRATEQLLSELRDRRAALLAAIAAVDQEEQSYAAEGRDYTDLQRLRNKRGRLEWDLRQLDEPPLLDQLATLRSEQQQRQRLEQFQSTQREEIESGLSLVQQGFDCFDRARKIWERAGGEGFAAQMITIPDVWARDILARVRSQLAGEPFPKLQPQPVVRVPAGERQPLPHEVIGHGASTYTPAPPVRLPVRALRHDGPPQAGEAQVVFLRGGAELGDGTTALAGDIVNVSVTQAVELVRHSAADYTAVSGG